MYCVIKTETTGLFDFSKPADAEWQPRLASFSWAKISELELFVADKLIPQSRVLLVQPDYWVMPEAAERFNNLSTDKLKAFGVSINLVLKMFVGMIEDGCIFVGFNAAFDMKVMRAELRRAGMDDLREQTKVISLIDPLRDICKVPARKGIGFKYPTFSEALNALGIDMTAEGLSSGKCEAIARLFYEVVKRNKLPQPTIIERKE
jgi:DNA polymerase III epsilon subunit-like protein